MKRFKKVKVSYESEYFDIEVSDEEIEFGRQCGINVDDDGELVRFHLDNSFGDHMDLLDMDDYEYESEEENENN